MCYRRGTKHHSKKYLWCFCLLSSVYPYPVHSVHKNIERMEGTVVHSIVICSSLNLKSKSCPKELSLCQKLLFYDLYIFALSNIFPTLSSNRSNNISLKYKMFSLSGIKISVLENLSLRQRLNSFKNKKINIKYFFG